LGKTFYNKNGGKIMKKFISMGAKILAVTASIFLAFSVTACSSDGGTGGGGKDTKSETTHLVKFNAASTEFAAENMIIKGTASSGGKEGYLVLNHKIDIPTEDVTIEADVSFSSLSGHVGLGFISVDGSDRKGYSMLTGQNIKNVSATLGGGGNGLSPSVSWAVGTTYHFKAAYTAANNTENGSSNCIVYTVYDASGTELGSNTTPLYYSTSDIVYPALGGTTAENASYSNIKIKVGSTQYTIDGLDEQTALAALSVSTASVRLQLNNETTVNYTCLADGSNAGIALDYDNTILEVTDDENGAITIKGIAPTTATTVKVINTKAVYITATITVVVEDFNSTDDYGELTSVYPANGATDVYEDGELRITFDNTPAVSETGSISIYDDEGNWVDTIKASDETIDVQSGYTINVKDQMIRVEGNAVYFTPHYGALKAGKTYFVAIPKDVITATLNTKAFDGLALNKDSPAWSFTVRAAVTPSSTITVDGSESSTADFRTVHGALLAIGASTGDYTINIAPGTYRELIHFNGAANITLAGTGTNARGTDTVIQWTNLNKWNGSMDTRSVVYFGKDAGQVVIKNLTIKNTCDRSVVGTADTQAEALYDKSSNKLVVYNSTLLSHQDTVCTRGPSWFYDCYIEGDTDFIWGYSDVALFEKCDLKCLLDSAKAASSTDDILFVSRCGTKSKAKLGKGYVLLNSTVTVEDGVTCYLGRNAGSGDFYDQIAVVNTAFTKEGAGSVSTDLWSGATYDYIDGKEDKVGLKVYGLTGDIDVSKAIAHVGTISAADYALEFNGRRTILNRVYVVEDDAYAAGSKWDETELTAWESDANAVADESKNNVYEGGDGTITVTWDFQNAGTDLNQYNGSSGTVKGDSNAILLSVDATTGKLQQRTSDAQWNQGTIIKVPVNIGSVVKVVSYPGYHNYNIGETAATEDTTTYTATSAGYVELTATSTSYLYSISVTFESTVLWDFQNAETDLNQYNGSSGTVKGSSETVVLTVDATTGKLQQRTSDAQWNQGTIIKVPVTRGQLVTIVSYPGYHNYNIGETAATEDTVSYTATADDAAKGFVELTATSTSYLYSIKLTTE